MDSYIDFWAKALAETMRDRVPVSADHEIIDSDLQKELKAVLDAAKQKREKAQKPPAQSAS